MYEASLDLHLLDTFTKGVKYSPFNIIYNKNYNKFQMQILAASNLCMVLS